MAKIKFTKMHGLGNDFVVVSKLENNIPDLRPFAKKICDRRFGIGCDQLLIISPSAASDFKMEIYNADGGEVEMCGNGIRCVAKYLSDRKLTSKAELSVETLGGVMRPRLIGELIEVDMGEPTLEGDKIPTTLAGMVINHPFKLDDNEYQITCVSMGNPHCVIFVKDLAEVAVAEIGPKIERHPLFPKRVNVEFVQVIDPTHLKMRVWERGAGETPACGTGACASLVAAVLTGNSQREATLQVSGGDLNIRWSDKDNHVYMKGPAEEVFSGEIEI